LAFLNLDAPNRRPIVTDLENVAFCWGSVSIFQYYVALHDYFLLTV